MASESTVGDVATFKNSLRKPVTASERQPGPYPYYGAAAIQDWVSDFLFEGLHLLIGEDGTVQTNDGRPLIQLVDGRFWVNNHAHVLVCDSDLDTRFLAYALNEIQVAPYVTGAAQPKLNMSNLKRIPVRWPDEGSRRGIAEVGKAIDDRIDNLRQTNATLEAIAQALFKSWFVDFDPVRAKAEGREPEGMDPATAALFPSEFEDSELGPIPKGWRQIAFGDVAKQSKGSVNPLTRPDLQFRHYSLPAFDSGQLPIVEPGEAIKSNKTPVPPGAVLVSKLNPHIPRVWFVGDTESQAVCSTEFLVWVPKPGFSSPFVYCIAASAAFNAAMRQLVTGTSNSHQRVKPDQLAGVQAAAIGESVIAAFDAVVSPMLQQIVNNRHRAAALAETRDTLLPRLISGKLRLPEAAALMDGSP